jgi:isoamylase
MLATVALAQGLPMICHGDELGRTQGGNPNAYDQDNVTSWIDWAAADQQLIEFTGRVFGIRAAHPVFRQHRWLTASLSGLAWYTPTGAPMADGDWQSGDCVTVTVHLAGDTIGGVDRTGAPIVDDDFLVLLNAWWDRLSMVAPPILGGPWEVALDSAQPTGEPTAPGPVGSIAAGATITVASRAVVVLQRARDTTAPATHRWPHDAPDRGSGR